MQTTTDHLGNLTQAMERAGRARLAVDLRGGYPVSCDLVTARAGHAIAMATRAAPSAKATIERHEKALRAAFRDAYQAELGAIVDGLVRP